MKITWKIVPILIILIGICIIGGSKIFAQAQEPILSSACEGKSGLLTGIGDGWSNKSDCTGKNERIVRLGNLGPNGTGNILFIFKQPGDAIFVLTTEGKTYRQFNNNGWEPISPTDMTYPQTLPAEVPPTSVAQWMITHFLDKSGNVWWFNKQSRMWTNISHP
jgi:hypothetical protein